MASSLHIHHTYFNILFNYGMLLSSINEEENETVEILKYRIQGDKNTFYSYIFC